MFYLELLKHAVHVIVFASAAHALVQLLQIVLGKRRVKPIRLQHTQTRVRKECVSDVCACARAYVSVLVCVPQ